jgi:hypothetical protein
MERGNEVPAVPNVVQGAYFVVPAWRVAGNRLTERRR